MKNYKLLISCSYDNFESSLKFSIKSIQYLLKEIFENPYKYLKDNAEVKDYTIPNKSYKLSTIARSIIKEPTEIQINLVIWPKYGSNRIFIITKDSIKYSRNISYEG